MIKTPRTLEIFTRQAPDEGRPTSNDVLVIVDGQEVQQNTTRVDFSFVPNSLLTARLEVLVPPSTVEVRELRGVSVRVRTLEVDLGLGELVRELLQKYPPRHMRECAVTRAIERMFNYERGGPAFPECSCGLDELKKKVLR